MVVAANISHLPPARKIKSGFPMYGIILFKGDISLARETLDKWCERSIAFLCFSGLAIVSKIVESTVIECLISDLRCSKGEMYLVLRPLFKR